MALGLPTDLIAAVGSKVFIGNALPSTYDTAGFDAVTWTEIGLIESIGEFGADAEIGEFTPLGTGIKAKTMGASDYGSFPMTIGKTATDDGLVALLAHQGQPGALPFKVELSKTGTLRNHRFMFAGLTKKTSTAIGQSPEMVRVMAEVVLVSDYVEAPAANTG